MPRLYDLYMDNLNPLKSMTVIMALISALVMVLQPVLSDWNNNLIYLTTIFPFWVWAILFGTFAVSRFMNVYGKCNWYASFMTSVVGIWLWSLMIASALIMTSVGGVDLLLLIPLISELWIMARTLEKRKDT